MLGSVIGHARVISLLRQAVSRGRVPQSLIFGGPAGVGKATVAMALAQAVNCPVRLETGGDDACGRCPTCLRIGKRQHADVVWLDKGDEVTFKIKALREQVLEVVGYRPFEAARRVYIIDPAEALTAQSQDALLKTLEEPPASAIFILVTELPDTLAATIRSRCRRLRFGPLGEADVARVLADRLGIDPGRARQLAVASGGSVERAAHADADHVEADRDAALDLLGAARSRVVPACLKAAAALAQHGSKRRDREALDDRLAVLGSLLRDLTHLGGGAGTPLDNAEQTAVLEGLRAAFGPARATEGFGVVAEARSALRRNGSPKIVADWVALSL